MKHQHIAIIAIIAGTSAASAAVISLSPLSGPSFESPDVADGTQSETMTGWASSGSGSRVMDPATSTFTNQFNGNTSNVPDGSQDFVLFKDSGGNGGYAWQALQGTSDSNPVLHGLTGDEAAGQTLRLTFWAGRGLGVNSYEDGEFHLTVGLQAQNNWNWHDDEFYTKLNDGWGDVTLNLGKDEWKEVTVDLTVPASPSLVNGHQPLVFAFNTDGTTPNASQIHIDGASLTLIPEPSSTTLLAALCGLGLIVRRRH